MCLRWLATLLNGRPQNGHLYSCCCCWCISADVHRLSSRRVSVGHASMLKSDTTVPAWPNSEWFPITASKCICANKPVMIIQSLLGIGSFISFQSDIILPAQPTLANLVFLCEDFFKVHFLIKRAVIETSRARLLTDFLLSFCIFRHF